MGRGRIPMELIQKEKARKTTFLKRKNGLMKKVSDFSTLCGVDVCVIIYCPNFDGESSNKPDTWPRDTNEIRRIIRRFRETTSDRPARIYDAEEYYRDRIKKLEGDISKVQKEKLKIMYPTWDVSFKDLREDHLRMFVSILDSKIVASNQRIHMLKKDSKGKATLESKDNDTPHWGSSNPSSQLPFYPLQIGQSSSQSSILPFDQNGMVNLEQQVGTFSTHDHGDGSNNQNSSSLCYYKGNMESVQPYSFALPQYQDLPSEFQVNVLYNAHDDQGKMFNYMHERKL
ncbi:hypothetical protein PIB30_030595 [Stylosanthes scabra]|uniref:MADS-box domain-containing protein n=1 Tax=Stylosanthes scabra TaxID=79078 RepID=A0ABU6VDU2_9FABA|nr:hypothetical protein [Stylosanthes scabra]